jgi:hypothetical protein
VFKEQYKTAEIDDDRRDQVCSPSCLYSPSSPGSIRIRQAEMSSWTPQEAALPPFYIFASFFSSVTHTLFPVRAGTAQPR